MNINEQGEPVHPPASEGDLEDVFSTVWIDDDCIVCYICEQSCPEVFSIDEESSVIIASARLDGQSDQNLLQHSPLKNDLLLQYREGIIEALEGCPVEVIKIA